MSEGGVFVDRLGLESEADTVRDAYFLLQAAVMFLRRPASAPTLKLVDVLHLDGSGWESFKLRALAARSGK